MFLFHRGRARAKGGRIAFIERDLAQSFPVRTAPNFRGKKTELITPASAGLLSASGPVPGLLGGLQRPPEAQLAADHVGRPQAPQVVTDRAVLALVQDLYAALQWRGPANQPHHIRLGEPVALT